MATKKTKSVSFTKRDLYRLVGPELSKRLDVLMTKERLDVKELLSRALTDYHNEWYVTKPKRYPQVLEEVEIPGRISKPKKVLSRHTGRPVPC
jgi:hypothetical protein